MPSDTKIPLEIITDNKFTDKQWAIDHAQIKAQLTGERWYVISILTHIKSTTDPNCWIFINEHIVCSEQEGADKYWGKPRHICYPLNPHHNRQQGRVFGRHKVKTTHM